MSHPQRILLVDDDTEALEMISEFLLEEGFTVETASDGRAALDKLETFAADLLVTDYEMPGMSGDELIQRAQERRPGQPALLVSAREDCSPSNPERDAGPAVACLQKPVDLDDLLMVARRLIEDARGGLAAGCSAAAT